MSKIRPVRCAGSILGCTLAQASLTGSAFQISVEAGSRLYFLESSPYRDTAAPGTSGLPGDICVPKKYAGCCLQLCFLPFPAYPASWPYPIFCLSRERKPLPLAQAACSEEPVWSTGACRSFRTRNRPLPQPVAVADRPRRNQPSPRCPGWCGGSASHTGSARAGAGTQGTAGALHGTGWSRAGRGEDLQQVRGRERGGGATERAAPPYASLVITTHGGLASCGDAQHAFLAPHRRAILVVRQWGCRAHG